MSGNQEVEVAVAPLTIKTNDPLGEFVLRPCGCRGPGAQRRHAPPGNTTSIQLNIKLRLTPENIRILLLRDGQSRGETFILSGRSALIFRRRWDFSYTMRKQRNIRRLADSLGCSIEFSFSISITSGKMQQPQTCKDLVMWGLDTSGIKVTPSAD